ncbi:MAG: HNH endonuclease signature motif containing protein [Anaeromyxobacteraceae bacterium]
MKLDAILSLDAELKSHVHEEHVGLVVFLRLLDVFDRAMAFAALGCTSTFQYLVRKLHLAEATAYRRVTAMKLIRKYPQLEGAIEEGLINLTQLCMLGPVMSAANVDDLVRKATHLTKRETEELVVSIRPKDVPADGLRKLPRPGPRQPMVPEQQLISALQAAQPTLSTLPATNAPAGTSPENDLTDSGFTPREEMNSPPSLSLIPPPTRDLSPTPTPPTPVLSLAPTTPLFRLRDRSRIEPVADGRWQWRIGLDRALKADLDTLKGYLAHKIPDGDLQKVFEQMLHDSLEKHGKRLGFIAPEHPRPIPDQVATPGTRLRVPLGVRRAVLARDGHRCTEVCNGERCPETERLEMDHLDPANETGSSTVDDLVTKCRTHNQYRAFLKYGREYIEKRKAEARREREERREVKALTVRASEVLEKMDDGDLPLPLPLLVKEPVAHWRAAVPYAAAGWRQRGG